MSQENKEYKIYQKRQKKLVEIIRKQLSILNPLDMTSWEETIQKLQDRVLSERFKILVLGEFKRGKSTFINALLQEEILPAKAPPCTAIINEVKWGESPKAVLHFREAEDGSIPPTMEIPVKNINKYVVIKTGVEHKKGIKENPYEKLELLWPLDLCKNGVEIIDSPGLNEHDIRQKVTIDYLSTVDAILFVLSCEALASKSEIDVINSNLRSIGHEDIFFICNRFDLIRKREKAELIEYGIHRLAPLTKLGEKGIFFISAIQALDGYLDRDDELVQESGVPKVQKELDTFLTTQRGRLKILQPSKELKNSIYEARRTIPERKSLLQMSLKDVEARYESAQAPLRQLERTRQNMVQRVSNFRQDMKDLVRQKSREFFDEVSGKIEDWLQEYEVQEPFGVKDLLPWQIEEGIKRIVEEVNQHIAQQIENEVSNWQESELQPFLETRLEDLMRELDTRASAFLSQVDQLRLEITGQSITDLGDVEPGKKLSPIERIMAAAGGLLLGNFGTASLGFLFGFEEMVKGLMTQIAVVLVTAILFSANPVVLATASILAGLGHGLFTTSTTTDKIKKAIARRYKEEFPTLSYTQSDEIANTVADKLGEIQKTVEKGLGNEIRNIEEQLESILKEKQRGQANVDNKLRELDVLASELNALDSELDELITQVALP